MRIVIVAAGGAIGSVARYVISGAVQRAAPLGLASWPLGTFVVNVVGCLAVGIIAGLFDRYEALTINTRLFLIVGVCGGFTTFSAFGYESLNLLEAHQLVACVANIVGQIALGLTAVWAGAALVRAL